VFRAQHAGEPVKSVAIGVTTVDGTALQRQGEFVISETGIEGSLVYALSAPIRDLIETHGFAVITVDLAPGRSPEEVAPK
jgi:predicted flavoprotein YhiN